MGYFAHETAVIDDNVTKDIFFEACKTGNVKIVKLFINNTNNDINCQTPEGWTGLIISCFNQQEEIAKLLIENGANINYINPKGTTVFMYAKTPILNNQKDTVFLNYLLENGANINALDIYNKTVLDYTIEYKADVLSEWMKSKGAKQSNNLN